MARPPCHRLDKVSEGRRHEHFFASHKGCPHSTVASNYIYIWSYLTAICNKLHCNPSNNRSIDSPWSPWIRGARALMVFRSGPRVIRGTITAIAMWRQNCGPWDNGASIAAHNNAASGTMVFRFKCLQHYHVRKTKWYEYHMRKTKWYWYADHVGCIKLKFAPCTGWNYSWSL